MAPSSSLPRDDDPRMRAELQAYVAAAGRTRALPTVVNVGVPGGDRIKILHLASYDDGLRSDLVVRALDGTEESSPLAWISRTGPLEADLVDLAWWRATRRAFAQHGLSLPSFCVMTRYGWRDLESGRGRSWARVRPRHAAG